MENKEKSLRERIAEAKNILIPEFGITSEEQKKIIAPLVEIYSGRNQYHPIDNVLSFNEADIDSPILIGEETSHYLHHSINPFQRPKNSEYILQFTTAKEFVGRYGALVYVSKKGLPILPFKKFGTLIEDNEYMHMLGHDFGYQFAYRMFELHGTKYLSQVARMNDREVIKFARQHAPQPGIITTTKRFIQNSLARLL